MSAIEIPVDVYDSQEELVVILPLGGVSDIDVTLEKTNLVVKGNRKKLPLKESLSLIQQECYWGEFEKTLKLPTNVYFDKITAQLTSDNVLLIIVPKVIIPEKISLQINSYIGI